MPYATLFSEYGARHLRLIWQCLNATRIEFGQKRGRDRFASFVYDIVNSRSGNTRFVLPDQTEVSFSELDEWPTPETINNFWKNGLVQFTSENRKRFNPHCQTVQFIHAFLILKGFDWLADLNLPSEIKNSFANQVDSRLITVDPTILLEKPVKLFDVDFNETASEHGGALDKYHFGGSRSFRPISKMGNPFIGVLGCHNIGDNIICTFFTSAHWNSVEGIGNDKFKYFNILELGPSFAHNSADTSIFDGQIKVDSSDVIIGSTMRYPCSLISQSKAVLIKLPSRLGDVKPKMVAYPIQLFDFIDSNYASPRFSYVEMQYIEDEDFNIYKNLVYRAGITL